MLHKPVNPTVFVGSVLFKVRRIAYSAPGRAGILGNPSDIYGGCVLSTSIPLRNYCTIEEAEDWDLPEDTTLWDAAVSRVPIKGKWKVTWETQVPRSSGLAGSTALLAATLACVFEANEMPLGTQSSFAELVRDIELVEAGVVCGYQDAYMVVHGGVQELDFEGKHPIDSGPEGKLQPRQLNGEFLLVTTGVERLSGSVHGPMRDRWLAGEKFVQDAMIELRQIAKSSSSLDEEGLVKAMKRNFKLIQELGGSGPEIDHLVQIAEQNGAKAAKLAGAGMGGTVICLTDSAEELGNRLKTLGYHRLIKPESVEGLRREQ